MSAEVKPTGWEALKTGTSSPKSVFTKEMARDIFEKSKKARVESPICAVVYGYDGTGKTGACMDCRTEEERKAGKMVIIFDLDDGAGPIKEQYWENDDNIVCLSPIEMFDNGDVDYLKTYDRLRALVAYVKTEIPQEKIKAVIVDGLDTLKKLCLTGDTPLFTEHGIVSISEYKEGRILCRDVLNNKTIWAVPSVHMVRRVNKTIKITTSSGRVVHGTPEHRMLTPEGFRTLSELSVNNHLLAPMGFDKAIDINPISFDASVVLGYLIAEGSLKYSTLTFSNNNGNILNEFRQRLQSAFSDVDIQIRNKISGFGKDVTYYVITNKNKSTSFNSNPVRRFLRQLGLDQKTSKDKFIPKEILLGDEKILSGLLRGMFLGDGWQWTRGKRIGYYTVSDKLRQDTRFALQRLGINSTLFGNSVYINDKQSINRLIDKLNLPWSKTELNNSSQRYHGDLFYDRIAKIEIMNEPVDVYDLELPEYHTFIADGLISHNSEWAWKLSEGMQPTDQIKDIREWQHRNWRYNNIIIPIKNMNCDRYFITHLKEIKKFKKIGESSQLVTDRVEPDWLEGTPGMMYQRILCSREQDPNTGVVTLKAKMEKSKHDLSREGKEFVIATVNPRTGESKWESAAFHKLMMK